MMRSHSCPKCQSSMSQGFTVDRDSSGGHKVSHWIEGVPQKSWFGLKTSKRATFEVQTWRCGRCGFLENYARG